MTWGTWQEARLHPGQRDRLLAAKDASAIPLKVWVNDLYEVWLLDDAGTPKGFPGMWHLSIKVRFTKAPVRNWRHLQRIKNELVGPEHEAVELFPAEARLMDTSNQYHLWVLKDAGLRFPFGVEGRAVVLGGRFDDGANQEPFEPGTEPPDAVTPQEAGRHLAERANK
jgi:hypothetical protein